MRLELLNRATVGNDNANIVRKRIDHHICVLPQLLLVIHEHLQKAVTQDHDGRAREKHDESTP